MLEDKVHEALLESEEEWMGGCIDVWTRHRLISHSYLRRRVFRTSRHGDEHKKKFEEAKRIKER